MLNAKPQNGPRVKLGLDIGGLVAYPNRTYGTITHPGSDHETSYLKFPVDGGLYGDDAPNRVPPIEGLIATEASGVGSVQEVSGGGESPGDDYYFTADTTLRTADSTLVTSDRSAVA